jgi:hypothetical protein
MCNRLLFPFSPVATAVQPLESQPTPPDHDVLWMNHKSYLVSQDILSALWESCFVSLVPESDLEFASCKKDSLTLNSLLDPILKSPNPLICSKYEEPKGKIGREEKENQSNDWTANK